MGRAEDQDMRTARGTLPIQVGVQIGSYEVCSKLGEGGMGVVYEAQPPCGKRVAVKVLHPRYLGDEHAVRRFRNEVSAGLIIHHPHVASTIDHGVTFDGIPFLVMERLHGEPLGTRIHRDGTPSLRCAVTIARQILAGLGGLHTAGIVHGDVKSDNVLVETTDGSDFARLIDLGLAHVQFSSRDVRPSRANDKLVSGTPEYMAPEVIRGEGSSMASDQYAVAVILYELITGTPPFTGGSPGEIVRRALADRVVPPSLRRADVPPILERIVLRALSKNPAERFSSVRAFAAALSVTMPLLDDSLGERFTADTRDATTIDGNSRDERRTPPRGVDHRTFGSVSRHAA